MEAIPFASATTDAAVSTSKPTKLYGWSVTESAGSPALASAVLRNGTGTGDPIVAVCSLLASTSGGQMFVEPVLCNGGLFLDRTAGSTTVVVYIG